MVSLMSSKIKEDPLRQRTKLSLLKKENIFFLINKITVIPLILWIGKQINMLLSSQMILDCHFMAYTSI